MSATVNSLEDEAGWRGKLRLDFEYRRGRSLLTNRNHQGPLTVQRPFYPEGDEVCHTYLLHPPAGIVGGDGLEVNLHLASGAHALLTTPGANRWYRSPRLRANVEQRAIVENDATLEWLPQETLVFDGARAQLRTCIELDSRSHFCGWEVLGFGRPACGEVYSRGTIDFGFEIFREGEPLFLERLVSLEGKIPGMLTYHACATYCATGADESVLARAREVLASIEGGMTGATLMQDLLVVRGLAPQCELLLSLFRELWKALRPYHVGRPAEIPRIWYT
ncbi:MAG: urease accessory protein UreD [Myxococcales bacterium]|nr:urease accessory protein UreD [Myxococcales bacterium]